MNPHVANAFVLSIDIYNITRVHYVVNIHQVFILFFFIKRYI